MSDRKINYNVIIESSVLYGKPVRKELTDLINNFKGVKNLEIKFYVPETVLDEAKRHLLEDFQEAKLKYDTGAKEVEAVLKGIKLVDVDQSKNQIFGLVEKSFEENNLEIIKTPYEQINWADLVNRAVYKKPPFNPEKDKEKGFRDAVIAETILINLPKISKDSNIVILVRDGLLSDFIASSTQKYNNLKIYPSILDFESAIKLHLLKDDDKLIDAISQEADTTFYTPLGQDSLFYKENLPQKILAKFPSLFANPEIEENKYYGFGWVTNEKNWIPSTEPEYRVSKPVFIKNEGNDYYWSSTVIYRQLFENTSRNELISYGFDMKGEWKLEFKVEWKVTINNKGNIVQDSAKTTNIIYMPKSLVRAVMADSYMLGNIGTMMSGATLAGQGTVPVASLSPSPSPSASFSPSASPSASPSIDDNEENKEK